MAASTVLTLTLFLVALFINPVWTRLQNITNVSSTSMQTNSTNNSTTTGITNEDKSRLVTRLYRSKGHGEQCISVKSKDKFSHSTGIQDRCALIYVCFNSSCRCPLGHAHQAIFNQTLGVSTTVHQCIKFNHFRCQTDQQCQDIDTNVVCYKEQCRCRPSYYLAPDSFTSYCNKLGPPRSATVQSFLKMIKQKTDRNTINVVEKRTSQTMFQYGAPCSKSKCTGEYFYCHRGQCKCWPEFQFVPNDSLSMSGNDTNANLTNVDETGLLENQTKLETELYHLQYGSCVRKLCQHDSECQTEDNPNLVCNNTICECRYGYVMYHQSKVCIKFNIRKQSCDFTCRIIGSLFAAIFLVTLLYWCFYCCYSLVKNYRNQSRCTDPNYIGDVYDYEPINFQRYLSTNTLNHNTRTSNNSRFGINLTTFLRIPVNDDPPSYSQAMADEALPDYDAVMELQELRKHDDKVET